MTARVRSKDERIQITGSLFYINLRYATQLYGTEWYCDDHIGNWDAVNPLSLRKYLKVSPVLNGTLYGSQGQVTRKFTSYPVAYHSNAIPDPRTIYAKPSTAQLSDYAWEILAKTNPSSPHVNALAFVGEMKDLPSLVRDWGRDILHKVAKGYISWRWAVKPMINDVLKLCDFVGAANKRFDELRALRDKKVMRRRVMLKSATYATVPRFVTIQSEGALLSSLRTDRYTQKVWGTAHWRVKSDSDIVDMNDEDLLRFTRRTMLGINTYGALEAAWELTPWSWFIDWFSNVGTMVSATNNAVGCSWRRLALMNTVTTTVLFSQQGTSNPEWVSIDGDFIWEFVRKERYPVAPVIPVPLPHLPILTNGKLSILAALSALRWKR